MAKVFISYSRKDTEFAKKLTGELQKSDFDFWIDWEGIPPTVDWWREIEKGIEEADVFLFIISPDSATSKICGQEIDTAVKNGKRIIPIVTREIEWEDTPPQLGHLNYIFFSRDDDFDTATNKLLTAIQTDYEWAATHRRLQVKALEWERNQKENGFLLRGKDLQDAEAQLAANTSKEPHPTDLQREHIFASRKATDRQRRILTAISVVGIIALAGLAIFGFIQAGLATNNAETAQANLVVANTAQANAESARATAVANEERAQINAEISQSRSLASAALAPGNEDIAVALALEATRSKYAPEEVFSILEQVLYPIGGIRSIFNPPDDYEPALKFPAISPDGKQIILNGNLYDLETGKLILTFAEAPKFTVAGIYLSDGKQVIIAGEDDPEINPNFLGLYDVESGVLIRQYDTGIYLGKIQLSADESVVIAYQPDGLATWWEVKTGEKLREFPVSEADRFSPDLKWWAAFVERDGEEETILEIRDTSTLELMGEAKLGNFDLFEQEVIAFNPDSSTLLVYTGNSIIERFWVPEAGPSPIINAPYHVNSLRFSPDGKKIVIATGDGLAILLDEYGDVLAEQAGHNETVIFADFVNNGDQVVSIDNRGYAIKWDTSSGNLVMRLSDSVGEIINDGAYMLTRETSGDRQTLIIQDLDTLTEAARITHSFPDSYSALHFDSDTNTALAFYEENDRAYVADLTTGEIVSEWVLPGVFSQNGAFSPDGRVLYYFLENPDENRFFVEIRDVRSGSSIFTSDINGFGSNKFSPDSNLLLRTVGCGRCDDSTTYSQIVDMYTGEILNDFENLFGFNPKLIHFTPDSKSIVQINYSKTYEGHVNFEMRSVSDGSLIRDLIINTKTPQYFLVHPDGKSIFTGNAGTSGGGGGRLTFLGTSNDNLKQWDFSTGELIREYPEEPDALWFTPSGKILISGVGNNNIFSDKYVEFLIWRFDTHEQLIAWGCANRYIAPFTAEQREQFGIESLTSVCAGE